MLNEFRARYPNGGLISELLQIDHGKYVVRVSVQIEGVTVATGLAAADTIETAEDQARIRAISLLNLNPSVPLEIIQQNSKKPETVIAQKVTAEGGQPQTSPILADARLTATQPKIEVAKPALSLTPPIEEIPEPILEPEELESNLDTMEFSYMSEPEEEPPVIEEIPVTTPEPAQKISSEPMDYSDIIARTNVEMKRLGWTSEQGRDYLIGTYGKRSRQLLDDEQLIEFLQYLESLPTS